MSRSPHWTLVSPYFWPDTGGVQEYLVDLCRALGPSGVTVIAPPLRASDRRSEFRPDIAIKRIPKRTQRLRRALTLLLAAVTVLKRRSDPGGLILGVPRPVGHLLLALVLRRVLGVRLVVCCYGNDLTGGSRLTQWLRRAALRDADCVVAISGYTAGLAARAGAFDTPITIVHPTVPEASNGDPRSAATAVDGVLRARHDLVGKKVLLTVGRLVARKGHDFVLASLPRVRSEVGAISYVIVGDGPERDRLERLAGDLGVRDCVVFAGKAPAEELEAWYRVADVFVMPSRSSGTDIEGFGIVYLEAGVAGTPAVAGRGGGVGDAVLHGTTGVMVNPTSEEEVTDAILTLLRDPARAADMGEAARRRTEREFGSELFTERVRSLLDRVAGTSPSR